MRRKNGATQMAIARALRLSVSTVNKVLNRADGWSFKKATKNAIFRKALEIGYKLNQPSKRSLADMIRRLVETHPDRKTSKLCKKALKLIEKQP